MQGRACGFAVTRLLRKLFQKLQNSLEGLRKLFREFSSRHSGVRTASSSAAADLSSRFHKSAGVDTLLLGILAHRADQVQFSFIDQAQKHHAGGILLPQIVAEGSHRLYGHILGFGEKERQPFEFFLLFQKGT